MKTLTTKQLAVITIYSGIIIIAITLFCELNQWGLNNANWFIFADGIIIFILGMILLLSTKQGDNK
jgi:hypothetical protein